MKKFKISLCYTGYVVYEVEAESDYEAFNKAEAMADSPLDGFERWHEADMIEELCTGENNGWRFIKNSEQAQLFMQCPFDEGYRKDSVNIIEVDSFVLDQAYKARCDDCGAEGPVKDTKKRAIDAWNRRRQ